MRSTKCCGQFHHGAECVRFFHFDREKDISKEIVLGDLLAVIGN